jgi:hypothetical protein
MAQRRKKSNNATEIVKSLYTNGNLELLNFGINPSIKQEEKEPEKLKKEKPAKTVFEDWARKWQKGDPLPFSPPGKEFILNVLSAKEKKPSQYGYVDVKPDRQRSVNEIGLMAAKSVLGPTLRSMPNALSLIARVARSRGIIVDDDGRLRCPAGTPAANQFTDLQMSNCLVPSARTLAADAADKIKPGENQLLSGNIAPGNRVADKDNDKIHVFNPQERAKRYLTFKKKVSDRFKIVNSIYGNVRSNAGAKKALLRAFPGIDRQSLNEFLDGDLNLYGEDLLNYLDFREQLIASLLFEASKNQDIASSVNLVFKKVEQLPENAAANMSIGLGSPEDDTDSSEPYQPFFRLSYVPREMAVIHKIVQDDYLVIGMGNDPENPLTASDFGAHTGVHEFGHMVDFHKFLTDLGVDTKTMDFAEAVERIEIKAGGTDWVGAATRDEISFQEAFLAIAYESLINDLSFTPLAQDRTDAFDRFYASITKRFLERGPFDDDDVAIAISQAVGSLYGQSRDDKGNLNNIETAAELYTALSFFPELVQEHIDELNNNQGMSVPDVDELAEELFGSGVITPISSNQNIGRQGIGTRTRRAVSTFVRPEPRKENAPELDDADIADYATSIEDAIAERARLRTEEQRKDTVNGVFSFYSPKEINDILSSIPESMRKNTKFITSLFNIPEALGGGKGQTTPEARQWMSDFSIAIQRGWIDFNAITAAYALKGGAGPVRTIRESARAVAEARKQGAARKRASRNAAKNTSSLSGNVSSNRAARRASKPPKIQGSLAQQKIQSLSGNMGYLRKNNIPINDEKNSPELMPKVSASIKQIDDNKVSVTWGDDSWEFDTSDTSDDRIWMTSGLPEWATFHGNFGMRYVASMLMGLDVPKSVGLDEDPVNAFGRKPIHRALMSGSAENLSDDDKERIRKMVEDTISALRSIQSEKNKRDYGIFRGLTGVPEGAQILGVKEGDRIQMPLSAFTPSETWATEMAEFTDEGEGVMLKVVPGAQTTASSSDYNPDEEGYWANAFEVVTAGEFEIISVEDPENEAKIITMRQIAVFDIDKSTYENISAADSEN